MRTMVMVMLLLKKVGFVKKFNTILILFIENDFYTFLLGETSDVTPYCSLRD
jgi:hypothetical protein